MPFQRLLTRDTVHHMSQTTLYNKSMHLLCIFVSSAWYSLSNHCWHLAQSILILAGKWSTYKQWIQAWGVVHNGNKLEQVNVFNIETCHLKHTVSSVMKKRKSQLKMHLPPKYVIPIHPNHIVNYTVHSS